MYYTSIILDHINMGFTHIKMEIRQPYQVNGYCKLKIACWWWFCYCVIFMLLDILFGICTLLERNV